MTQVSATAFAAAGGRAPQAIRIGDVFDRSYKLFTAHWIAYCSMTTFGYAPIAFFIAALGSRALREAQADTAVLAMATLIAGLVLGGIILLLAPAAINHAAAQVLGGRDFSFGRSIRLALRRAPAILALTALIWTCAAAAGLLFIAPAFIVLCMNSVAVPACVIEGLGPIRSMSRSAFLTKGNRWRVFGVLGLVYFVGGALDQAVGYMTDRIDGAVFALALSLPVDVAVSAFSALVVGVLYDRLRLAREGVDIEHIAGIFD